MLGVPDVSKMTLSVTDFESERKVDDTIDNYT